MKAPIDPVKITNPFSKIHQGVDLRTRFLDSPRGIRPVYAVDEGLVRTVGEHPVWGKYITIWHQNKTQKSYYGHLSAQEVINGQKVSIGQIIGYSGKTGSSATGPHLHFEFAVGGVPIDPAPLLL